MFYYFASWRISVEVFCCNVLRELASYINLIFPQFFSVVLAVQEDAQPDITDGYYEVAGIFHFGFYLPELNAISSTHCLSLSSYYDY